jgi:hypothetical protein
MDKKNILILLGIVIIMIVSTIVFAFGPKPDYYTLANCLTEKGIIMAGTDWCPACKSQREIFGDAFAKITYINCDNNNEWCTTNNIQAFPTWVFPDGTQEIGVKDFSTLNQFCSS